MQKQRQNKKHIFAIYVNNLDDLLVKITSEGTLVFKDQGIWRRITKVIRLEVKDKIILFNQSQNLLVELEGDTFGRSGIVCAEVLERSENKTFQSELVFCCPVLKKDSFAEVVYFAAEVGVTKIIPIITDKVQRKWGGDREIERLRKIIISAAEQSKNFSMPEIQNAILFKEFLSLKVDNSQKIHFNVAGESLINSLCELKESNYNSVVVTLGPEGDFTDEEKMQLQEIGFKSVALTPTVLTAVHAAFVGLGSIRTVLL